MNCNSLCSVVEGEFFNVSPTKLCLKEVSVFHLDTFQIQTFVVKPHLHHNTLARNVQCTNNFTVHCLHRIPWVSGTVEKQDAETRLQRNLTGRQVYTKGTQKAQFFTVLLGQQVFNLE